MGKEELSSWGGLLEADHTVQNCTMWVERFEAWRPEDDPGLGTFAEWDEFLRDGEALMECEADVTGLCDPWATRQPPEEATAVDRACGHGSGTLRRLSIT